MKTELILVDFENEKGIFDIPCEVEYIIENSGIGGYEYWGFKGYDEGYDYITIENITPICDDIDILNDVKNYIEKNYKYIDKKFKQEIENEY